MAYCDRCERYFRHDGALRQHQANSQSHFVCNDCNNDFESWVGLEEHYVQSPRHHYCRDCNKHFQSHSARENHMNDCHWYCQYHGKVFNNETGLKQHYVQSPDHDYCQYCDEEYQDEEDLHDHAMDEHYTCDGCRAFYENAKRLKQHKRQDHHYCEDCDRIFQSSANLNAHRASSTHTPRTVRCPGQNCGRAFVSMSALTLHFESNTCPSGLTRAELNRRVVAADRNNVITNPGRLLTGPNGARAPVQTSVWATNRSWNGSAFECMLCNRTFALLDRLNQHLRSPRHGEKIYRCPKSGCGLEGATLSGLIQHVEAGSCGVRRFKQVQSIMDGIRNGMRTLTL